MVTVGKQRLDWVGGCVGEVAGRKFATGHGLGLTIRVLLLHGRNAHEFVEPPRRGFAQIARVLTKIQMYLLSFVFDPELMSLCSVAQADEKQRSDKG